MGKKDQNRKQRGDRRKAKKERRDRRKSKQQQPDVGQAIPLHLPPGRQPVPMAAFCPVDQIFLSWPAWSFTVAAEPGSEQAPLDPGSVTIACGRCGGKWPVFNLVAISSGEYNHLIAANGPEDVMRAIELAAFLSAHPALSPDQIADEIEARAPWLSRIADEVKNAPVMTTAAVGGLILNVVVLLTSQGGITQDQMEELIRELKDNPTQSQPVEPTAIPPTAAPVEQSPVEPEEEPKRPRQPDDGGDSTKAPRHGAR